ncbi:hypothetical protein D5018_08805 [Parashewanella curva]|uniref:Uncharacterized protein n=2 Tax=Parashewanella curva TaxID=2338552 RepID=A0A3L8PXB4_9GAMM|nr:hypothetical protein D5018_08805 [Parashewanella curva]
MYQSIYMSVHVPRTSQINDITIEVKSTNKLKEVCFAEGNSHKLTVTRSMCGEVEYKLEVNQDSSASDGNEVSQTSAIGNSVSKLFSTQSDHKQRSRVAPPICCTISDKINLQQFNLWLVDGKTETIYKYKPAHQSIDSHSSYTMSPAPGLTVTNTQGNMYFQIDHSKLKKQSNGEVSFETKFDFAIKGDDELVETVSVRVTSKTGVEDLKLEVFLSTGEPLVFKRIPFVRT